MNTREQVIRSLYETLHRTLPYFDADEAALSRSYGPGKWTMREILLHLADTEAVYIDRARRLVAEEKAVLQGFDENRWAAKLSYDKRDLALARLQFDVARRCVIEIARLADANADGNTGIHTDGGTRTFGQIINSAANHNAHHLEQIEAIAAGKTWTKK